jgi:hypothetical protein
MSDHLTQDQISRWIIGQSTPEEEQHGRECSECSAELGRFQDRVSSFRVAMHEWSGREVVPRLEEFPKARSQQRAVQPSLRWALVTVMVAALIGIPVYQHMNKPAPVTESVANFPAETAINAEINADVLLMEEVNAHLSRPMPMPMERVMALLPSEVEQPRTSGGPVSDGTDGKEIR